METNWSIYALRAWDTNFQPIWTAFMKDASLLQEAFSPPNSKLGEAQDVYEYSSV